MGMDPMTGALIGSTLIGGLGDIFGAQQQSQTNSQNYQMAQQNRQMLENYARGLMQPQQSPYSSAILQFLGMHAPGQGVPTPGAGGLGGPGTAPQMPNTPPSVGGFTTTTPGSVPPNAPPTVAPPTAPNGFNLAGLTPNFDIGRGGPISGPAHAHTSPSTRPPATTPATDVPGSTAGAGAGANAFPGFPSSQPITGVPSAYHFDPSAFGLQGFNSGQDSALQLMRANLSPSDTALNQMAQTGNPFNLSPEFSALQSLTNYNTKNALANYQGSLGSYGQRYGTAAAAQQQNIAQGYAQQLNSQEQQLANQAYQNAQQNQLAASSQLAGRAGQMGGALAQDVGNQFNLANLSAQQGNIYNQLVMQALGMAGQQQQAGAGMNNQLLGILAGVPVVPQQVSPWPGAVQGVGQQGLLAASLPSLMGTKGAA